MRPLYYCRWIHFSTFLSLTRKHNFQSFVKGHGHKIILGLINHEFFMKFLKKLLNVLLPPRCLHCGQEVSDDYHLCPPCWKRVDFIVAPFCFRCGSPLEFSGFVKDSRDFTCTRCLSRQSDYDQLRSAVVYGGIIQTLTVRFKHGDASYLAPIFADWLNKSSDGLLEQADYMVPIPLHWTRLLWRRYNQSALLALSLLALLQSGPVYAPFLLRRCRLTPSQGHKKLAERQQNVKDAFRIPEPYKALLKGKTVVLIDDVVTTGATLNECSRTLKEAGCRAVYALTVARVKDKKDV